MREKAQEENAKRHASVSARNGKNTSRTEATNGSFIGTVAAPREKMEECKLMKFDMVQQIRRDLSQARRTRDRSNMREMKQRRRRRDSIMAIHTGLRYKYDEVQQENKKRAREHKEEMIKEEILRISRKDCEARKLERAEEKILKRLKEAHQLQRDTI